MQVNEGIHRLTQGVTNFGFAERARTEAGTQVWIHRADP